MRNAHVSLSTFILIWFLVLGLLLGFFLLHMGFFIDDDDLHTLADEIVFFGLIRTRMPHNAARTQFYKNTAYVTCYIRMYSTSVSTIIGTLGTEFAFEQVS